MAQSPESNTDSADGAYAKSWDTLGALIAQGKSFSGRERNCVFLNLGGKEVSFACASGAVHLDHADDSRAVIPVDWDGDGDLDLWYSNRSAPRVRFMRNDMVSGNAWLALQLEGRTSNRDAIGARAELTLTAADGTKRTLWRRVKAGDGFLSQAPKTLHFGFRAEEKVERLVIRWPAPGVDEDIVPVPDAGRLYKLTQAAAAHPVELKLLALAAGAATLPAEKPEVRAVLANRLPVPKLEYLDLQGHGKSLEGAQPQPLLVLFWGSWCPVCTAEMHEMVKRATELSGVRILALAVDTAKPEPEKSAISDVRAGLSGRGWKFDAGFASQATVRALAMLEARALYPERPLALPSAYLIGTDGKLAFIYHGRAGVEQLVKDAALAAQTPADPEAAAFPFSGRSAKKLFPLTVAGQAQTLRDAGYFVDARALLEQSLPNSGAGGWRLIADLEESAGRWDAALAAWKKALAFAPDDSATLLAVSAAMWKSGEHKEATAHMQRAALLNKDAADFQNQVGKVWQALGEHAKARDAFTTSLAAAPENAEVVFNRAVACQFTGATAEAIAGYESVLKLNPQLLDAASNLAWLLATAKDVSLRQPDKALALAQQLAKATAGQNPAVLDNLAAAQASTGDLKAAAQTAQQALALARATGEASLLPEIARHLEAYKAQRPWVE